MPVFAQMSATIVPRFSADSLILNRNISPFPAADCLLPAESIIESPGVRACRRRNLNFVDDAFESSDDAAECLSRRLRYSAHGLRSRIDHASPTVLPTAPSKPPPELLETLPGKLKLPEMLELTESPTPSPAVAWVNEIPVAPKLLPASARLLKSFV